MTLKTTFASAVLALTLPALSQTSVGMDSIKYVVPLHDVEIVGVKQNIESDLELRTVIDTTMIRRLGIDGVKGLSSIAPNVFMPQYGSRMTSSFYVRGLGARIDQPVVGLCVDNVPVLNKDAYDFSLADIERIEILRGSAGVLNGRNAMAGQININTLSPWDYRGFRMAAQFGRANTANASASWYGLLTDRLATSFVGQIGTTDGFYKNEYDGKACGEERLASARWKLSWHPHSRWSVSNTAHVGWSHQDGYPYENLELGKIAYNDSTFYQRINFTDALTASYTGKRMVATSITSVQYLHDNMTLDQDFSPQPIFTLQQKRNEWSFTEDIFAKGIRGKYQWLIGAFGFAKKTHMEAPVTFLQDGIDMLILANVNSHLPSGMSLHWDSDRFTLGSLFDITDGGFALYHQSTLKFGQFTAQAGLRWDIEHIAMDYTSRCFTSCTMGRTLPNGQWMSMATRDIDIDKTGHLSQTFNQLLPQVSLSWEPSRDWAMRVSVAKGYKAGGYNTQMFSDVLQQQLMESLGVDAQYDIDQMMTYKPEKSWTYEFTVDAAPTSGSASASLTFFLLNCTDQQLTVFPKGLTTGRAMTNAGRTRSFGAEFTGRWQPLKNLDFSASYGWTRAKFRRYNNGIEDLRGKRLPYAPAHTLFIQGAWRLPWEFFGISTTIGANTRAAGDIYWDDINSIRQKFYATLGASITFQYDVAQLTIWGENLTNTKYNTFYFESLSRSFAQRANPWAVGGTIRIFLPRFRR